MKYQTISLWYFLDCNRRDLSCSSGCGLTLKDVCLYVKSLLITFFEGYLSQLCVLREARLYRFAYIFSLSRVSLVRASHQALGNVPVKEAVESFRF